MRDDISAFSHSGDLIASRVFEGRLFPVETAPDAPDPPSLEQQESVVIDAGAYRHGDTVFDVTAPGVYRFQPPGRPGLQAAVLPKTVSGIASVTVELGALGNTDRNKGWPVMSRIARHRRLLMHCVQFSNLSVYLATQAGLTGRTWLMWNYDAVDAGDLLSSHAISELSSRDGSDTRLFDLSFGVELTLAGGHTDFAAYQSALLEGDAVAVTPISHAFGFEYGSRFFNPHSDDFDLDVLAASPDLLIEAHRRLARGAYVIGRNLAGTTFVTKRTRSILSDLPQDALSDKQRSEMASAKLVNQTAATSAPDKAPSAVCIGDTAIGYLIADGTVGPIPTIDRDVAEVSHLSLPPVPGAGLSLSSGAVEALGDQVLDMRQDGIYRLRSVSQSAALQIVVATRDPLRFVGHLLEILAAGALHDDMATADLQLVSQSAKAVAQGDAGAAILTSMLSISGIPYRLWRLSSDLSARQNDWPVPVRLICLEVPDATGRLQLIDLDRGLALSCADADPGFAGFERAVQDGASIQTRSIRRTPAFAYGTFDGKTALTPDILMPFWLGDSAVAAAIWQSALSIFPAIAKDASGRECTTQASQARARTARAAGRVPSEDARRILDCPNLV